MVPVLCGHTCSAYVMVNCELQPLIEKSVRDFNLVGAVMSHVTPIWPLYRDTVPSTSKVEVLYMKQLLL